ncbi:MAG: tetraacyldisaccharide 4'-kinase [Orrella sp.]|uniref:tetraacyldisaccharide 4'-kinase n=1 Tax=Orrella sp. TaxID=1921583 RepID=UPI003BDEAF18
MRWPKPAVDWLTGQWRNRGVWYWLMQPASWLYSITVTFNRWLYARQIRQRDQLSVPVIVVGNLYIGGTGKTPVAIALAKALTSRGFRPGLISRGYGSSRKTTPATAQGVALDWQTFGDEPALIANRTGIPVSVHANRFLAGCQLLDRFPEVNVIISDDGLQHQRLARDVELLVEDDRGVGNGATLPGGPLREASRRRATVDAILRRVSDTKTLETSEMPVNAHAPTFGFTVLLDFFYCPASGQKRTIDAMAQELKANNGTASRTAAIAGIGVPERFFQVLEKNEIKLDQTVALSDHAPMTVALLESIDAKTILVTEKDAIKFPVDRDPRIWVASAGLHWADDRILDWLIKTLHEKGKKDQKQAAINQR